MSKKIFITSLLILTVFPSAGHKGHKQDTSRQKQLARDLYNQAAALTPAMLQPLPSPALPHITPGRQKIDWNNTGSDIIRNFSRIYRHELHNSCPFAIDENELTRAVPDHVARGMISAYMKPIVTGGMMTVTELGSKYGKTAAVLKAGAEVVETAVSLSTPLKGFHLLCEPIDILIFFLVRKAQIYGRVFKGSQILEHNRFAAMVRLAWIRRKMIKGLKKVLIQLESDKIDYEGLESVNKEGRKNNRMRWVQRLSSKVSPLFSQIREIDSHLEEQTLSPKKRKKLTAKKDKLYRKIAESASVSRKDFFGSRYGMSLFLFSRKGKKTHLRGHAFPDKLTSHHWLWPLQIQDILDRSLVWQASEEAEKNLQPTLKEDEIRQGLAEEFYDNLPEHFRSSNREEHIQSMESMLGDIERIFDPSLSVEKKHFLAFQTEMLLTSFFNGLLHIIHEEISKNLNIKGGSGLLWSQIKLRWKLHRFDRYSHIYSDFLFAASLAKNKTTLVANKYEAMEHFLALMDYLIKLDGIARSEKTAPAIFAALDENIYPIQASQVSKRKRTTFSLIPFQKPKTPLCRDLIREIK